MSENPQRTNIYELVLAGSDGPLADRIAYSIANEAVDDPDWRKAHDTMLDNNWALPELFPVDRRPQGAPGYALDAFGDDPAKRAALLWGRVVELGHSASRPDAVDMVAAVVAAEIWLAALRVPNFNSAASYGCDSVRSVAAILARSVGGAGETNSVLGSADEGPADVALVRAAAATMRTWAISWVGADAWPLVRDCAASDLAWRADGGSLTSQAAAILAGF